MRGIVHDRIVDIVMVLLENAGFDKVKTEDLWWDAEAAYSDADHRRLDVTCVHPVTGEKLVFDVVVWWGASKGFREDGGAVAASQREVEAAAVREGNVGAVRRAAVAGGRCGMG